MVHDDKPRGFWKIACVQDLITGRDGQVRGAMIKTGTGSIMRRPLQKLYPLEIKNHDPWKEPLTESTLTVSVVFVMLQKAYAAVVYLVIKMSEVKFIRFITSKTRVAPLKTQSIPQLEHYSWLD